MTFDVGEFFRSLDETTEESASLTTLWLILPRRVRSSPLFMFGWNSTEAILGTFKLLLPDSIRNTRCHKKTASTGEIKSHHCSLRSRTETKNKSLSRVAYPLSIDSNDRLECFRFLFLLPATERGSEMCHDKCSTD
jgi:hypothetical protein